MKVMVLPLTAAFPYLKLADKVTLEPYWAFSVAYDCPVVFRFLADDHVLLANIGTHDEVY